MKVKRIYITSDVGELRYPIKTNLNFLMLPRLSTIEGILTRLSGKQVKIENIEKIGIVFRYDSVSGPETLRVPAWVQKSNFGQHLKIIKIFRFVKPELFIYVPIDFEVTLKNPVGLFNLDNLASVYIDVVNLEKISEDNIPEPSSNFYEVFTNLVNSSYLNIIDDYLFDYPIPGVRKERRKVKFYTLEFSLEEYNDVAYDLLDVYYDEGDTSYIDTQANNIVRIFRGDEI